MSDISINPLMLEYGLPALLAGLVLGALLAWLFFRHRNQQLKNQVKNQEAIQREREVAFEAANAQLTRAFTELANQCLRRLDPVEKGPRTTAG